MSKIVKWLSESKLTNRLVVYFILYAIIIVSHVFLSRLNLWQTDVDSARYMLSALIQSEAAIVSIVITMSLVVVQLAASSYSVRVVSVFKKNPDLWILIGIYGFAIFWGLGVLKLIKVDNSLIYSTYNVSNIQPYISFTYYLGIFVFVALVPYLINIFDLLKVSSIIDILARKITKENILSSIAEESHGPNELLKSQEKIDDNDPIQPIIDIIRGSLMKYDYETARYGLRVIGKHTTHIFENEIDSKEYDDYDPKNDVNKISKYIFSHLARFGKLAVSKEDEDLTIEVIYILFKIGNTAASKRNEIVTRQALDSIVEIGIKTREPKFEFVKWKVVVCLESIGLSSALQKLEIPTDIAISYIETIGTSAVKQNSNLVAKESVDSIHKIGEEAILSKLERASLQTTESLKIIAVEAGKQNDIALVNHISELLTHILKLTKEQKMQKTEGMVENDLNKLSKIIRDLRKHD